MRLKKSYRHIINEVLQPVVAFGISLYLISLLFVFRIKSLVSGFAEPEKIAITASQSVARIFENPMYAPHKAFQYILGKLANQGFLAMRGVSLAIGLLTVICFYYIVRRWFGFKVAVLTTFLLVTSSWMLFTTRLASPEVMFFSLIAAVAYGTWLQHNPKRPRLNILLGSALTVWLIYIPGMIWFVILGSIWQRKQISNIFKENKTLSLIATISITALVMPLLYAVFRDQSLFRSYIGFGEISLTTLKDSAIYFILIPFKLFVYGDLDPVRNLGRMPYLDFFASIMVLIGGYNFFVNDKKLDRFKMIAGCIILTSILIAFGKVVGLHILLPFMYILVASGLDMLLTQWFKVFPSNPFAKVLIIVLIVSAFTAVTFYNLSKYFIAWPQAPITKSTFNLKL